MLNSLQGAGRGMSTSELARDWPMALGAFCFPPGPRHRRQFSRQRVQLGRPADFRRAEGGAASEKKAGEQNPGLAGQYCCSPAGRGCLGRGCFIGCRGRLIGGRGIQPLAQYGLDGVRRSVGCLGRGSPIGCRGRPIGWLGREVSRTTMACPPEAGGESEQEPRCRFDGRCLVVVDAARLDG